MKLASLSFIAAVASVTSAMGDLGFNLGVKDNKGNCKTATDYANDFKLLLPYTKVIKIFSVSDCNALQILGPAAEEAGFQVLFGVWPTFSDQFEAEKNALRNYLPNISLKTVKAFTVGSEALYRKDMTAAELASAIESVRSLLRGINDKHGNSYSSVPVGTVESWNVIVDGGSVPAIKAADFVYANAFSYWQGQEQKNASYSFFDDIMQALQTIQTVKGSTNIDFWVGETGWPTNGANFQNAYPSVSNARDFWMKAVCAIRKWGVNVFYFEAFDEPHKPDTSGVEGVEKYWGVFDSDHNLKFPLDC